MLSRLDVEPGHYLVRIAGIDESGPARGSVQFDLDVPDFGKAPLTMSGLALASASELRRPTTGSDHDWKQRFTQPPTTKRTFSPGDELIVSGEVYVNDGAAGEVDTTTVVQRESGEAVFRSHDTLKNPDRSGRTARFPHQTGLSLQAMEPGAYLLMVEAKSTTNPRAAASRQIPFTVR